jgi:hypothetical protein
MPTAQTSGFDLVLQMSKKELDESFARFAGAFPQQPLKATITLPLKDPLTGSPFGTARYDANVALSLPTLVSFKPPAAAPGAEIVLRSSFAGGSALTLKPELFPGYTLETGIELALAGSVEMRCQVGMESVAPPKAPATGRSVVAKLDTANITISVNAALTVGETTLGRPITVDKNTLINALGPLGTALSQALKTAGSLPLTFPIPIPGPGTNSASRVSAIDFSAFEGTPEGLAVGVSSQCGGRGSALGLRTNPGVSRLLCSNAWLVCFVCRSLESTLGLSPPFTVDMSTATGTWTGSITLTPPGGGGSMALTSLTVSVPAGASGITISGSGSAGGFCWSAAPTFSATVRFTCTTNAAGQQVVTPITPPGSVSAASNVSIPALCIVVAAVLVFIAALLFGIIGAIIAAVVAAIVLGFQAAANPVAVATGAINTMLGMPLPVPAASLGIPCGLLVFDDLEVRGTPVYHDYLPKRSQGQTALGAGQSFNLDAGLVASGAASDLTWTGARLQGTGGTELILLGGGFNDVTYRQLQMLSFSTTSVQAAAFPTAPAGPLVFGARTSEGLYARCAARRTVAGGLELTWVTYDRPSASLSITTDYVQTDGQQVDSGTDTCTTLHIEPSPPLKLMMAGAPFGGGVGGGGDPRPWNPYAAAAGGELEGGEFGEREPDGGWGGGSGGGFGGGSELPTVHDLAEQRNTRWGVVQWAETEQAQWVRFDRAEKITLSAVPELMTYPAKFRWTVAGTQVPAGSGQTTIAGVTVTYDEDSNQLVIQTQLGIGFVGQVCCTVTDADGRQLSACVNVKRPGQIKTGGCQGTIDLPGTLLDFAAIANDFGAVMQGVNASLASFRADVAAHAPPATQEPPQSFKAALKEARRER